MKHIAPLLKTRLIAAASLLAFGHSAAGAPAFLAVAHPQGYQAMSMQDDLAHRSPDSHWPTDFEPVEADLFAHNDLVINASCERVWRHIVDAKRWPLWYPNSKGVEIQGGDSVLRDGTVFRWTTFGLTIDSTVHEFVPNQRLGWYGYVPCGYG
jgi:Polyketide cyclase / dehydrase and lipid transport